MKTEDMNGPTINDPRGAMNYMGILPNSWVVPLYDLDGNVIGESRITFGR